MNLEIWSLGRPNEAHLDAAISHYLQKIKPYNSVELHILQLPKKAVNEDAARAMKAEEALILKRLQPHHYLILLDENGKLLSSVQWAAQLTQLMNQSVKTLVLLIGGAHGVTDVIRQKAAQTWSLSKLVFPHQLVRLIVAEQVYRAFSIINNSPYHHA